MQTFTAAPRPLAMFGWDATLSRAAAQSGPPTRRARRGETRSATAGAVRYAAEIDDPRMSSERWTRRRAPSRPRRHPQARLATQANIVLRWQSRPDPRAAMSDPPPRIRVVNPNSNEDVTRGLDAALEPLRFANGPEIVCSTLAEGPFGIETQADVESVVMPLRRMVEADNSSDAFVIACYSDPGLHVCREGTTRP